MTKRTMLSVLATPDINSIRTATLYEQSHTVIPAVVLVEGVLWPANAPSPELALAEEFGRFAEGWNGRPVMYDHPRIDGNAVSASTPNVLEGNAFGQMFNTRLDGAKLKTEIWINESRVSKMSEEAQGVITQLKEGSTAIEVSTGLFTMSETVKGTFNGEEYEAIWRNIVPDHLAVLPPGVKGACSVEDGCGAPRTNQMQPVMRAAQLNTNCECSGGSAVSLKPNEEGTKQEQGLFKRLLDLAGGFLSFRDNSKGLSDRDLRMALNAGLVATDSQSFFFILAVFENEADSGKFVYEMGFDGTLFERGFAVASDGTVTLSKEVVAVRPVTTFVPVNVVTGNSTKEINMTKQELVNALVANEATQYSEEDREWLTTLEEAQLTRMAPVAVAPAAPVVSSAPATAPAPVAPAPVAPIVTKPVTTEDYIAAAPAELRQVLNSGLAMHRQRKDALVNALMANTRNKFSKQQLDAKEIDELETIVALSATEVSYAGAGANLTAANANDDAPCAAPLVFAAKAASAA